MRSIVLVMMLVGVAFVAAIRLLPWWAALGLCAAVVLSVPTLLKWGLVRLLKAPFKAKGAVLRGARAEIHSIEHIEPQEAGGSTDEPREYYRLAVTITPHTPAGPFTLWEPGELTIVGADTRSEPDDDESAGDLSQIEVEHDGQFHPDEGMKYPGPQRLRLLIAAKPGQRALSFRYYFEVFGTIELPAPDLRPRALATR
jgi:hypothetical protein